jgi:hypothetical protein
LPSPPQAESSRALQQAAARGRRAGLVLGMEISGSKVLKLKDFHDEVMIGA